MEVGRISTVNLYNNQNRKNNHINFQGRLSVLNKDPIVRNLINSAQNEFERKNIFSKFWGMLRRGAKVRPGGVLDANGNPVNKSLRADLNDFSGRIYLYRLNGDGIPETITQELYRKGTLKRVNSLDLIEGKETHTYYGKKLDNGNRTETIITRDAENGRLEEAHCTNIDLYKLSVWEKDENGQFTYYDRKNGCLVMVPDKGIQGYLKSDDAIYGFKHIGYPNGYIECRKSDLNTNLIGIFHMPRITGCIEAVLEMFKNGDIQRITTKNCK